MRTLKVIRSVEPLYRVAMWSKNGHGNKTQKKLFTTNCQVHQSLKFTLRGELYPTRAD